LSKQSKLESMKRVCQQQPGAMVANKKNSWMPHMLQKEAALQLPGQKWRFAERAVHQDTPTMTQQAQQAQQAGFFVLHSARCEHFELGRGDVASMEADGNSSSVNLLPVTAGSNRTAKRRFRRNRCRQRARLLAQFPQLATPEMQDW